MTIVDRARRPTCARRWRPRRPRRRRPDRSPSPDRRPARAGAGPTPTPPKPARPPQPPTPQPAKPTPRRPSLRPPSRRRAHQARQAKPKPADKPFDLDALAASLATAAARKRQAVGRPARPRPRRDRARRREPARATPRGLSAERGRRPGCQAGAAAGTPTARSRAAATWWSRVSFSLRQDGRLAGPRRSARQARRATAPWSRPPPTAPSAPSRRGAPYSELPRGALCGLERRDHELQRQTGVRAALSPVCQAHLHMRPHLH